MLVHRIFLQANLPRSLSDFCWQRVLCQIITPLRGNTAARSVVQPRDWSDINGSGPGTTGIVGWLTSQVLARIQP